MTQRNEASKVALRRTDKVIGNGRIISANRRKECSLLFVRYHRKTRRTRGMCLFHRTCVLGGYLCQQVAADKESWKEGKEWGVPFRNHKDLSSISVVLKDIALFSHA